MKQSPPEATPRRRQRATRRKAISYSTPMKIRMAYLAGMGRSAREIGLQVGVEDPKKVRSALRKMGVKLLRDAGTIDLIMVRVDRPVAVSISEMADAADATTEEFSARVLTLMCVEERVMLRNLLGSNDE